MSKTILITGASSGIGKATAILFQKRGWNVVATMRSPEKEKDLTGLSNVICLPLDVTDEASVEKAIKQAWEKFQVIDAVVNNAGYGLVGAFEDCSVEQIAKQFNTNVFGLMSVCRKILPNFRKQKKGVIVNISSIGGRVVFPFYSLYHASKWAVEGFSESLQIELKAFNIRVKIVEPGPIKTDFYQRSADHTELADSVYKELSSPALAIMNKAGGNGLSAESVAEVIYGAVTDQSWKLRYPVGIYAKLMLFSRRLISDRMWQGLIKRVVGLT